MTSKIAANKRKWDENKMVGFAGILEPGTGPLQQSHGLNHIKVLNMYVYTTFLFRCVTFIIHILLYEMKQTIFINLFTDNFNVS